MAIIDITGKLYNGMWNYEPPFPQLDIRPLPEVGWVRDKVWCDIFDGLHSQSGTYLETPAHMLGERSYMLGDIDISKLVDIETSIIKLDGFDISGPRRGISREMLEGLDVPHGGAVLISCRWGQHWEEERFLASSPFFERGAMEYLIERRPFLIGTDFPRWENLEQPQGFFDSFYNADILMLAPCVSLEKIEQSRALLTVLPINIPNTCCAPCRAFLRI